MNQIRSIASYHARVFFALTFLFHALSAHAVNTVAQIAVGKMPLALVVNPVSNKVYVANSGEGTVSVINGATHATTKITVGASPSGVAVNPVTNKIYVTNSGDNSVSVIDGTSNGAIRVAVGSRPYGIAVNDVTNKIYVTNLGSNSVSIIDGATNAVASVNVGASPLTVAVNVVTNKIYVANYGDGTVTVADGVSHQGTTVKVGTSPVAVAVNPVTNKIYVVNNASNNVSRIDGANNSVTSVNVGHGPHGIAIDPVINAVYVTNTLDATVSELNEVTRAVGLYSADGLQNPNAIALIPGTTLVAVNGGGGVTLFQKTQMLGATNFVPVGGNPIALVFNPVTQRLYVANVSNNSVSVIDAVSITRSTIIAPTNSAYAGNGGVAVDPVGNKLYFYDALSTITVFNANTHQTIGITTPLGAVAGVINPVTQIFYAALSRNGDCPGDGSDWIMAVDPAGGTATIPVGKCPQAVAVNAVTNRLYAASLNGVSVVDGTTRSVVAMIPLPVGFLRPTALAVNPVSNKIYVALTDSIVVLDGNSNTVVATIALSNEGGIVGSIVVDPALNRIYATKEGTNILTIIDGASNGVSNLSLGAPVVSLAVNPLNHRIYAGVGGGRVKVVLGNSIISTASLGVGQVYDPVSLTVNPTTNKIYATILNGGDSVVATIDGVTHRATLFAGFVWAKHAAINPITDIAYINDGGGVSALSENLAANVPERVTIAPLPANRTASTAPVFTLSATSNFLPAAPAVRQVYYQVDTQAGAWKPATPNSTNWQATLSALTNGVHTLYAFATDGQDALANSPSQSGSAVVGKVAAYLFVKGQ